MFRDYKLVKSTVVLPCEFVYHQVTTLTTVLTWFGGLLGVPRTELSIGSFTHTLVCVALAPNPPHTSNVVMWEFPGSLWFLRQIFVEESDDKSLVLVELVG